MEARTSDGEIADVVIVGGGPAGLTIASELAHSPLRVILLETGSHRRVGGTVEVLDTLEASDGLSPLDTSRAKGVGGSANGWTTFADRKAAWARFLPLDPEDFAPPASVPTPEWPIEFADLAPYYRRAYALSGVDVVALGRETAEMLRDVQIRPPGFRTNVETFVPAARFSQILPRQLMRAENISILTNALATSLDIPANRESVKAVTLRVGGLGTSIRARTVVLAAGGIENTRILLASDVNAPMAGYYFNDHHMLPMGTYEFDNPDMMDWLENFDLVQRHGSFYMAKLQLEPEVRAEFGLLNANVSLRPVLHSLRGRSTKELPGVIGSMAIGSAALAFYQRSLRPKLGSGGWSRIPTRRRMFSGFFVRCQIEQQPNATNRVVLGTRRDASGALRGRVENHLSRADIANISTLGMEVQRRLESLGARRTDQPMPPEDLTAGSHGMSHHMSTTRMSVDAASGVVDSDCRVHGVDNLYCMGTSVFTTGGYANPTLSVVAMAIRLADHLRGRLLPR